jgi:hypothetical protein
MRKPRIEIRELYVLKKSNKKNWRAKLAGTTLYSTRGSDR